MKQSTSSVKRKVWLFFLLTFIYSWLLWLPYVLSGFGLIKLSETITSLMTVAVMLGAFGPLIMAVLLIRFKEGRTGLKSYFRNAFSLRTKPIYYVVAFLLPVLITALAHYIVDFTNLDVLPTSLFPEDWAFPTIAIIIPYFIFILVAGGGQEEFGWRGYAQEPMQQRFGILGGSIIIGLIWGLWHLPLWFMPGEGHSYYSFFAFLIYTVSTSIIIGWLYNASGKKLVIAWIIHAAGNVAVPFFPVLHMADVPQPGYWVWVSVSALVAICMSIWYIRKQKQASLPEV